FEGHGYEVYTVAGDEPARVHEAFAETLFACHDRIREIRRGARERGWTGRPRWPMIVLRTPKGWTGPREVAGQQVEGTFRSHQVPLSRVREDPAQLRQLEDWLRSYRPQELFDELGRPAARLREVCPTGEKRMSATP